MTTLEEQINNQKKNVLEQKRQIMEAKAELLLNNALRRNDMNMGAEVKTTEPKAFEITVKSFARCSEAALQLAKRSRKLVSLYTGENEPQREESGENVDSIVLTHVLQDIENELSQRLAEISRSLDKLEKAW